MTTHDQKGLCARQQLRNLNRSATVSNLSPLHTVSSNKKSTTNLYCNANFSGKSDVKRFSKSEWLHDRSDERRCIEILPHLAPGRYRSYKVPLQRQYSTPTLSDQNPNTRSLNANRLKQLETSQLWPLPYRGPILTLCCHGEYRHTECDKFTQSEDPMLWIYGNRNRNRQPKDVYFRYVTERVDKKSRTDLGAREMENGSNKNHNINSIWTEKLRLSGSNMQNCFKRKWALQRELDQIDRYSMFTLLSHDTSPSKPLDTDYNEYF